jgi:hypothetical protein
MCGFLLQGFVAQSRFELFPNGEVGSYDDQDADDEDDIVFPGHAVGNGGYADQARPGKEKFLDHGSFLSQALSPNKLDGLAKVQKRPICHCERPEGAWQSAGLTSGCLSHT